jgi:hypothetical protein
MPNQDQLIGREHLPLDQHFPLDPLADHLLCVPADDGHLPCIGPQANRVALVAEALSDPVGHGPIFPILSIWRG